MARVNFREVAHRFRHIDARFVSCHIQMPGSGSLTVEIYPWWEHPSYVQACKAGDPWGFDGIPDEAYLPVTVYPIDPLEVSISAGDQVVDWTFTQHDPVLWPYESLGQIIANQPIDPGTWPEVVDAALECLPARPSTRRCTEWLAFEQVARFGSQPSFSLGRFPHSLFLAIKHQLAERGIEHLITHEAGPRDLPWALVIDDCDYIVAADFELEVPEFVHDPAWFRA